MSAKVVWQTKSPIVLESFKQKKITSIIKGGNVYNFQAAMALAQKYDVTIDESAIKQDHHNVLKYYLRHRLNTPQADVTVKENYPVVVGAINKNSKNVALIHHIDKINSGQSYGHKVFFVELFRKLRKMDLVITVSEYWKNFLEEHGCKNVKVIYNSFIPEDYQIEQNDIAEFRNKYSIPDKPIVYIGNAHKQKGVYEAYNALKDLDVELIMTDAQNLASDLPVRFLSLSRKEFVTLLHASEVVVLMSKLMEGWNRVAHEALLCNTPVVGSGTGGMGELLTKSKQIITTNEAIKENVETVLKNRSKYINVGYDFVKQFDMNYFNSTWQQTVASLIGR